MFPRSLDGFARKMARFVYAFMRFFLLFTVVAVKGVGGAQLCKKCKKTPAATGHHDYCKRCYKEKHPRLYEAKAKARKKGCVICGEFLELNRKGVCKPCRNAGRVCDKCGALNTKKTQKFVNSVGHNGRS